MGSHSQNLKLTMVDVKQIDESGKPHFRRLPARSETAQRRSVVGTFHVP